MLDFLTYQDGAFTASEVSVSHFPAGEPHIAQGPKGALAGDQVAYLTGCDADELISLAMWATAVHSDGGRPHAVVPYLPGARADREPRFEGKVYAGLFNASRLATVVAADPHSPAMPAEIQNLVAVEADEIVGAVVSASDFAGIIAPDHGAVGRASAVADRLGLPVFKAEKHRDFETGRLSGFSCEPLPADGQFLVVDDICDGGGTFIGLASAVPESAGRLHLWVTHGVFSDRSAQLHDAFSTILTTDSHPGCRNIGAQVHELRSILLDRLAQVLAGRRGSPQRKERTDDDDRES